MSETTNDVVAVPNAEARKYRIKARELKSRVSELESQLANITKERDDARHNLTSLPVEQSNRIAELESLIRTRTHKDAFARLAKDKVRPEALDDAFTLSGWKVEGDDIDENEMGQAIAKLVEVKPYFAVADATKSVPAETGSPQSGRLIPSSNAQLPKPVPGLGRGHSPDSKNTPVKKNPQKI